MRNIFTLLAIAISISLSAQNATMNYGKWGLGFNIGGAYQQGDVTKVNKTTDGFNRIHPGMGFGFTLDYWMVKNQTSFFGLGLRGRYLHATSRGINVTPSSNTDIATYSSLNGNNNPNINYSSINTNYFHNYETKIDEGSLELMLSLNKLRASTGILMYGFGGIGIFDSQTRTDLLGPLGMTYDYSNINLQQSNHAIQSEIADVMDGHFESAAENNTTSILTWDPTVGFGLGYDFGPVSLALEHKISFPRHDNLDGVSGVNNFTLAGNNDVHHYTHFGIILSLGGSRSEIDYENPIDPVTTTTTTPLDTGDDKVAPPVVTITKPNIDPYKTSAISTAIAATVTNVAGKSNIAAYVNGSSVNFTYMASNNTVHFNAMLKQGVNKVKITGTNPHGTASDETTIIFEKDQENVIQPPKVTITKPNDNPHVQLESEAIVTAKVYHVNEKDEIVVKINNQYFSDFQFDKGTGLVMMNIDLVPGENFVQIGVMTDGGSDKDETIIVYDGPKPTVKFTSPSDGHVSNNANITAIATVTNVDNKQSLTVSVNGQSTTNFTYSITNQKVTLPVTLKPGENLLFIKGVNAFGMATDQIKVIYRPSTEQVTTTTEQLVGDPPKVTIITPANAVNMTDVDKASVRAKVENVDGKSNITFTVNGQIKNSFTYSTSSKILMANLNLVEGQNKVVIKGTNKFGNDSKQTIIIYKKPTTTNNTTTEESSGKPGGGTTSTTTTTTTTTTTNTESTGKPDGTTNTTTTTTNTVTDGGSKELKPLVIIKSANPMTATSTKATVKAQVKNVKTKSQIKIRLNNKPVTAFTYNANTKMVTFSANINEGVNKYTIAATNSAGSDSKAGTINYTPCKAPTMTWVNPPSKTMFYNGSNPFKLKVNTKNVSSKTEIIIYFNGDKHNQFTFNTKTGLIAADLPLKHNVNTVKIVLNTKCGNTSEERKITYRPQTEQGNGDQPVITHTTPNSFPYSTSSASVTVKGNIQFVSKAANVEMFINGRPIKNFTFSAKTGAYTVPITLGAGKNILKIKAQNEFGITTVEYEIVKSGS